MEMQKAASGFTVRVPGTSRDHVARINHRRGVTVGKGRCLGQGADNRVSATVYISMLWALRGEIVEHGILPDKYWKKFILPLMFLT